MIYNVTVIKELITS